ncbi:MULTISPECIES: sugar ABC transporter permease [unclassified Streptomyces]|uniref:carbohydrate ABC transporter permease n=1 Tax=unclassified Streptomyces TaxID=2593676 RepID=UPI00336A5CA5
MSITVSRTTARKQRPADAPTGRPAGRRGPRSWKGYLYALPALTVLTLFILIPLGQVVQISLYHWDGLSASAWAGAANYAEIVSDPLLRDGFVHSLVLLLFYAAIPVTLALVLAAATTRAARMRGVSVFRALLFLPQVIAQVVTATAWTAIYAPDGVLNQLLSAVGLKSVTRAWLGDFSTALPAVGLIGTWLEVGLCLVLFTAGIGQIPRELYEAAKVDGAGAVREFFAVTLPGLRGQITVALTLTVIAALRTFDLVYVSTHGGPGNSTSLPAFEIYNRAFNTGQVGSACAIAVALTLLILVLTLLITRLQPDETEEGS